MIVIQNPNGYALPMAYQMRPPRRSCTCLIYLIGLLCLLVGAACIAAGIYLNKNQVVILYPQVNSGLIAAGAVLVATTLLGWCGVANSNKCLLLPYTLLMMAFMVLFVVLAAFITYYRGILNGFQTNGFSQYDASTGNEKTILTAMQVAVTTTYNTAPCTGGQATGISPYTFSTLTCSQQQVNDLLNRWVALSTDVGAMTPCYNTYTPTFDPAQDATNLGGTWTFCRGRLQAVTDQLNYIAYALAAAWVFAALLIIQFFVLAGLMCASTSRYYY